VLCLYTKSTDFKTTFATKKRPLWLYLALYVQFSQCALFTKATLTNYTIRHNFNCHINERETPKTCLTNHKGSISHYIMPIVINSFGGRHTHTCTHMHTYRHYGQKQFQETSCVPGAPGLKRRIGIIKVLKQDEDTGDLQILLHLRSLFRLHGIAFGRADTAIKM